MKMRVALITLLVGSTLLSLSCTTTRINPGTQSSATYRLGALRATVAADMDTSYQAAEAAAQDLGLSVVQRVHDKLESQLSARDAQDKKVKIVLVAVTAEATQVTIRVGSADKAARIYQTLLDKLPKK